MATRQEVMAALLNRMQIILPANGFITSMGGTVTQFRKSPYSDADTLPALNLRDAVDTHLTYMVSGTDLLENRAIRMSVDVVCKGGSDSDDDVRSAVEDVLAALGLDPTLSGTVLDVELEEDSLQVEQDEYKIAGATLNFMLVYRRKTYGARTVTLPAGTTMTDLAFRSYVAKLSQVGSGDPSPTIVGNTLSGPIIWVRNSQGVSIGTLANAFTLGKTFFPAPNIHPSGGGDFQASLIQLDDDRVQLEVRDPGGNLVDGFTDLNIEIRVYL